MIRQPNKLRLIITGLIALTIPITVITTRQPTRNQSQASTSAPLPSFVPIPSHYPPTLTPFAFNPAFKHSNYRFTIAANDRDPQEILQITALGLPPGLILSDCVYLTGENTASTTTCTISGSPEQSGDFQITLVATDKMGQTGRLTRQLHVKNWYEALPLF